MKNTSAQNIAEISDNALISQVPELESEAFSIHSKETKGYKKNFYGMQEYGSYTIHEYEWESWQGDFTKAFPHCDFKNEDAETILLATEPIEDEEQAYRLNLANLDDSHIFNELEREQVLLEERLTAYEIIEIAMNCAASDHQKEQLSTEAKAELSEIQEILRESVIDTIDTDEHKEQVTKAELKNAVWEVSTQHFATLQALAETLALQLPPVIDAHHTNVQLTRNEMLAKLNSGLAGTKKAITKDDSFIQSARKKAEIYKIVTDAQTKLTPKQIRVLQQAVFLAHCPDLTPRQFIVDRRKKVVKIGSIAGATAAGIAAVIGGGYYYWQQKAKPDAVVQAANDTATQPDPIAKNTTAEQTDTNQTMNPFALPPVEAPTDDTGPIDYMDMIPEDNSTDAPEDDSLPSTDDINALLDGTPANDTPSTQSAEPQETTPEANQPQPDVPVTNNPFDQPDQPAPTENRTSIFEDIFAEPDGIADDPKAAPTPSVEPKPKQANDTSTPNPFNLPTEFSTPEPDTTLPPKRDVPPPSLPKSPTEESKPIPSVKVEVVPTPPAAAMEPNAAEEIKPAPVAPEVDVIIQPKVEVTKEDLILKAELERLFQKRMKILLEE